MELLTLALLLAGVKFSAQAAAAEPQKFAPPKPPSLEQQELDDDEEEAGDQPAPPPNTLPPPPVSAGTASIARPAGDFRPGAAAAAPKVKFEIVPDTFYVKGKPRGRAEVPYRKQQKAKLQRDQQNGK